MDIKRAAIHSGIPSEQVAAGPKYDDNYYDLDDGFIDDGDLEINHDEMVTDMLFDNQSNVLSHTSGQPEDPNELDGEEGKEGLKGEYNEEIHFKTRVCILCLWYRFYFKTIYD